ncbi:hypothetical protein ACFLFM_005347, partial [Salmonella enterica]
MLRYREFQPVHGTDCLPAQDFSGASCPLGIDLFLLFFADSGPKRTYQIRENAQKPLKQWHNAVWWLCVT